MTKEKIINYLKGKGSAVERQAIQRKLAEDSAFALEVEAIKADVEVEFLTGRAYLKTEMKEWLTATSEIDQAATVPFSKKEWETTLQEETTFLAQLKKLPKQSIKDTTQPPLSFVINRKKYTLSQVLGIAASLLVVLSIGFYQWGKMNYSNATLLEAYYDQQLSLTPTKGGATINPLSSLKNLVHTKQYEFALEQADQLLVTTTDQELRISIYYLIAQTYQRQGAYPNAIRYFELLEAAAIGVARQKAQINCIVLHLLNGDKAQALAKLTAVKEKDAAQLGAKEIKRLETLERAIEHPIRRWVE